MFKILLVTVLLSVHISCNAENDAFSNFCSDVDPIPVDCRQYSPTIQLALTNHPSDPIDSPISKALYHIKFDFFACNDFKQKPEPSTIAYRACTERFLMEVSQFIEAHEDRFGNESLDTRYFCGKDMEFVYMQLPRINFLSEHFMTLFTDDNQKAVFYLLSRCSQKVH